MDIQYNRNEDVKTVSLSSKTSKSSKTDEQHGESENQEATDKNEEDVPTTDSASDLNGYASKSDKSCVPNASNKIKLDLNDDKDIETTVIFVPNIWSLMPNSIEYQKIVEAYKNYIDNPPIDEEEAEPEETKTVVNLAKQENSTSDIKTESDNPTAVDLVVSSNDDQSIKQEATDVPQQEATTDQQDQKDSEASLLLKAQKLLLLTF